jgi:ribonuclease Y
VFAGYQLRYLHVLSKKTSLEIEIKEKQLEAEAKALKVVERAEAKANEIEAKAKAERKEQEDRNNAKEVRLEKKEELLDERQIALDSEKEAARAKIEEIKMLKSRLDERKDDIDLELSRIAGLTKEAAYHELLMKVEREQEEDLNVRLQKLSLQNEDAYATRAQNVLLTAIHRIGNSMPTHFMTANVELPNDEIKGKIIGKEGRNVRTFERLTGVDVLIDETPGYVTLSSFDPIRREVARVALETLMKDGRIQPARIEEVIDLARKDVAATVRKMGEKACFDVGVTNLHPDLVSIIGRLFFRTSYGQNVLAHSVEVAHIAGIIAEEVGANVAIAKAGALLHDIGKTVSHEVAGTHVDIGIRILQKYNVDEKVILAMRAHHEEYPYETPESVIVQVADALSGARPGARRDSIENYIKRLTELEAIATELVGVQKAFAISAGREIRVMVNPEELSDIEANQLARTIAMNIEAQLRYPGEIKVHVIREMRVVSYAR